MFLFKSCTRCRGDMRLETDISGDTFVHCLNCGHSIELLRRRSEQDGWLSAAAERQFRHAS